MRTSIVYRWACVALLSMGFQLASGSSAQAADSQPSAVDDAAARCAALVGSRFENVPGAPTVIMSAEIASQPGAPEFCHVSGVIAPQITITMRLPTHQWNGKLFVSGCGGVCGTPVRPGLFFDVALDRGYAVIANDMGHHSGGTAGTEGQWAYNNELLKMDFGFRATHATTLVGKAIVAAYYAKPQKYSYFQGCSTGGRQGLISAQRYPDDFDGIIAGAPVNVYASGSMQQIWAALSNRNPDESSIMKRPDVEFLHRKVVETCDAIDGLKDGIVENPRKCGFDPGKLECKAGETKECLTSPMVEVARKLYRGPVSSKGEQVHAGVEPGSEMSWISSAFDDGARPGALLTFGMEKLRYISYDEGPSWNARDFNWDTDPPRARGFDAVYAANNPDLRKFKARGGKMIQYHGWYDETAVPANSTDYYEATTRTMGGQAATQDFYRLYMIPSMGHCSGGAGATVVDYLTALEQWVEQGQAPDRLVGRNVKNGDVMLTRPHFPYPDVARYTGKGDPKDAANFKRVTPAK